MKKIETNNVKTKPVPLLVNVIGNICSGKSTLMDKLVDVYPEAHFLKIDDYRKQYNAIDAQSDGHAWRQLIKDAIVKKFVFVESTSTSTYYKDLQDMFPGTALNIFVDARFQTCLRRYNERQNKLQISEKYSIESSMFFIQNSLFQIWQRGEFNTVIVSDNGIDNSDLVYIQSKINITRDANI